MMEDKSSEIVPATLLQKKKGKKDAIEKDRDRIKKGFLLGVLTCAGVLTGVGALAVYIIAAYPSQAKLWIERGIDKIAIALPIAKQNKIEPTPTASIYRDGSLSSDELQEIARSITVRVFSGQSSGSGIIIEQQEGFYTVLTNGHVLNRDEQHKIETPDNNIHEAELLFRFDGNESGDDLAVLQFTSKKYYDTVKLDLSAFQTSEEMLAAGFPFDSEKLVFMTGKTTVMLDRALKGGYQMAYLINIQKGMSGGPLLNSEGGLVGVNGKHQPLWGAPYKYKNGLEVKEYEREQLDIYSWAISIHTFLQQTPPVLLKNMNLINLPSKRKTAKKINQEDLIELHAESENLDAKILYQEQEEELAQVRLTLTHSGKILLNEELSAEPEVNIHDVDMQIIDLDNDAEPEVIVDIIAGDKVRYSYSWIYRLVPEKQVYEGQKHFWGPVDDLPSYEVEELQSEEGEKTILLQSFNRQFARELAETDAEAVFPLQLWDYDRGEIKDVTQKYPDIVKEHTLLMFREYVVRRDRDLDLKNVLAAYLAEKYLLSEGEEGWGLVEAAYQKEEDSDEYFDKLRIALEGMGYIRYGGRS